MPDYLHHYFASPSPEEIMSAGLQATLIVCAVIIARLAHVLLLRIMARLRKTSFDSFIGHLLPHITQASQWLLIWCACEIAVPFLTLSAPWQARLHHILYALMLTSAGWVLTGVTLAGSEWLNSRYTAGEDRNDLRNRSIQTQLRVFTHVIVFVIWLFTLIAIIMTIPHLRNIGISLFASAGVAGIVIGMAATPTLSNLIAGIQLALTQPIRIGDQIGIENVSGIVEEIDSTYVVVKLWDLRRLIVPLNYFIQNRFQNWTHSLFDSIIGTVTLNVDYTTPIEPIRQALQEIVKTLPDWDGKICRLQVTDIKDNKMVLLQVSVSTMNVINLYGMQCDIREKLLAFIQPKQP